jgi:hypothetical protein
MYLVLAVSGDPNQIPGITSKTPDFSLSIAQPRLLSVPLARFGAACYAHGTLLKRKDDAKREKKVATYETLARKQAKLCINDILCVIRCPIRCY